MPSASRTLDGQSASRSKESSRLSRSKPASRDITPASRIHLEGSSGQAQRRSDTSIHSLNKQHRAANHTAARSHRYQNGNFSAFKHNSAYDLDDLSSASRWRPASAQDDKLVIISSDDAPHEEQIEEYTFSSEGEMSVDDDLDDVRSHISLSSLEDSGPDDGIDERPWLTMTTEDRRHYEHMFNAVLNTPIGDTWEHTEAYQSQLDVIMLKYIEDFPVSKWVIDKPAAQKAYDNLIRRNRYRSLGISIYGSERLPEMLHTRPGQAFQPINGVPRQGGDASAHSHPRPTTQLDSDDISKMSAKSIAAMRAEIDVLNGIERVDLLDNLHAQYAEPASEKPAAKNAKPKPLLPSSIKKEKAPVAAVPSPNIRVPPYPAHKKPTPPPQPTTGRRNARRPAEAEVFPWTRDIDFEAAKLAATWDDTQYDTDTLRTMAEIRRQNEPIIERLDDEVAQKQRLARTKKKNRENGLLKGEDAKPAKRGRKGIDPNDKTGSSDPYHSGNFAFHSEEDEKKAAKIGYDSVDGLLSAGILDIIKLEQLAPVKICWNPGKKGTTHNLRIAPFSARDTVITRKQLEETPILNRRAAECIIDFSPDLLWRDMLLRIVSEAGCTNKDLRDRFCLNGCHADKATFTKRLSAALGQKQTQSKSKGYAPGEEELYEKNCEDFKAYSEFFGKRASNRHIKVGLKRAHSGVNAESSGIEDELIIKRPSPATGLDGALVAVAIDMVDEAENSVKENDAGDEDYEDGVSVQNSDDLDALSD